MRIYVESLGCRLNYAEMMALGRELVAAGHALAVDPAEADLCVVNSCAVTGEAARQSRQLVRRLGRVNPDVQLVVSGCLATLEREGTGSLPNVKLVVGNDRKDALAQLVQDCVRMEGEDVSPTGAGRLSLGKSEEVASEPLHRTRAFVKVQDGCRHH